MKTASGYDVFNTSGLFDEYMARISNAQSVTDIEDIFYEAFLAEQKKDILDLDCYRLNYIAFLASRVVTLKKEVADLKNVLQTTPRT